MGVEIRPLEFERRNELRVGLAFAFHWDEGELGDEPDPDFDALYEADRTRCAFEGDEVVGTLTAFSLDLRVPGGSLPAAGTTAVTVRPTHRRRGLLRALMAAHFEDVRERGEPTAALWASESGIYRRFGYGAATWLEQCRIDRSDTAFAEPATSPGSCRMVDADEALAAVPRIYERVSEQRPGMMARSPAWWRHRVLRDAPYQRDGGTPHRRVLYQEDGEPRGYLLYRTRRGTQQQAVVQEILGMDAAASVALYRLACSVDFVETVLFPNEPLDGPLPLLLADTRKLQRHVRDALWLRLMDLPAALAGRRYRGEGRLRLEVRDELLAGNAGTWELETADGGARCRSVAASDGDVRLDVADLSAAFLGGTSFRSLARAGRATGSAEALARADALFGSEPLPWNAELF